MAGGEQREYYVDKLHGLLASAQTELGRVRTERDEARVGRDAAKTELARTRARDGGLTLKGVEAKTIFPTLNSRNYIEFRDNIKAMATF